MRLIKTLEADIYDEIRIYDIPESRLPAYAILSHKWLPVDQEITFKDRRRKSRTHPQAYDLIKRPSRKRCHDSYKKIINACIEARCKGYDYIWIDTVCINKSDNTELATSITSMFRWYKNSALCVIYLDDFRGKTADAFQDQRIHWLERGWTLQELIAPRRAIFYNRWWEEIGERNAPRIAKAIHFRTNINIDILCGRSEISSFSVAQRMSWAAHRKTERPEDKAYCLQGLFDVHMFPMYGEGGKEAFLRLQRLIAEKFSDLSIFAWETMASEGKLEPEPLFATDPSWFAKSGNTLGFFSYKQYTLTNKGVEMSEALLIIDHPSGYGRMLLLAVGSEDKTKNIVCIELRKIGKGVLQRQNSGLRALTATQYRECFTTSECTFYIAAPGDYREQWAREYSIHPRGEFQIFNPVPETAWNFEKLYFHNSLQEFGPGSWRAFEIDGPKVPNLAVIITNVDKQGADRPILHVLAITPETQESVNKIFSRARRIETNDLTELFREVPELKECGESVELQNPHVIATATLTPRRGTATTEYVLGFRITQFEAEYTPRSTRATTKRTPRTASGTQGVSNAPFASSATSSRVAFRNKDFSTSPSNPKVVPKAKYRF